MMRENGLNVLHREGIYLEWLFNYFRTGKKMDVLPCYCNKPFFRPLVAASMVAGNVFRPWAQDLVFVARKHQGLASRDAAERPDPLRRLN
jgi:hypothetical protein